MMKELIKKIKEISTKYKSYTSNEIIINANNRGVVKGVELCLKEINEQESKPFNPVECGFVVEFNKEGQKEYFLRYGNGHYKLQIQEKIVRLSTYVKHRPELAYLGYPSPYKDYITIRIPNHRFGVELLRNLGVIE